jgi:hypothetical protein
VVGECLDEIERLQKHPNGIRLSEVLCGHGIIDQQAIDDPEYYDNYKMVGRVIAAAKQLREER